jgi:hypothetical protein
MAFVKTLDDAVPFLSPYATWVKVLVALTILMVAILIIALLFSPKTVPIEKWLLASDVTTVAKAVVPDEMFQEWQKRQHNAAEARDQIKQLADELATQNISIYTSTEYKALMGKGGEASSDENLSFQQIERYITGELAQGKWLARGIPNEAPLHDNEQIMIKPAQWQYLRLSLSGGDAIDRKSNDVVYKGVEIGRPKG